MKTLKFTLFLVFALFATQSFAQRTIEIPTKGGGAITSWAHIDILNLPEVKADFYSPNGAYTIKFDMYDGVMDDLYHNLMSGGVLYKGPWESFQGDGSRILRVSCKGRWVKQVKVTFEVYLFMHPVPPMSETYELILKNKNYDPTVGPPLDPVIF